MVDLVIRGATVVDGLGHEPKRADVAVKDGRIVAIGEVKDPGSQGGAETIDAGGLTLTPGIVDVHTHYDAQMRRSRPPLRSASPPPSWEIAASASCRRRPTRATW